jgi:hypothetical protein
MENFLYTSIRELENQKEHLKATLRFGLIMKQRSATAKTLIV